MLVLTPNELKDLTGCAHKSKQAAVLNKRGIPFLIRRDGSIVVLRPALQEPEPLPLSIRAMMEPPKLDGPATILDFDCVYFLQFIGAGECSGLIKIGFSTRFRQRWWEVAKDVRCEPEWLRPLATIPGTMRVERSLHRRFREWREFGEWFVPAPEILAFVAECNSV